MAEHDVKDLAGRAVGKVALADGVFAGEVKTHLFHEVVSSQLASRRAGTASTKPRGEVRGGGKKPFRQKGTGRARRGTNRSPLMPGGGTVWGPHPRSYAYKVPRKVRKAAVRSAMALRREQGKLIVLDEIRLPEIATKRFAQIVRDLEIRSGLFVLGDRDRTVELSARNLPGVTVLPAAGLNCYDILRHETLVIARDALPRIEEVYGA